MEAQGTKLQRTEVVIRDIDFGLKRLEEKLFQRLNQKGNGAYVSRHEILGILEEEVLEVKEAIRADTDDGYDHYAEELLDTAVVGIFGYICIKYGYIPRPSE